MITVLAQSYPGAVFGEASDGDQALAAVRSGGWDLLILDLSMPGQSGFAVLEALRDLPCHIPVLVLSMESGREYVPRLQQAGASGFVSKSASPARVIAAVSAVLSGQECFVKN